MSKFQQKVLALFDFRVPQVSHKSSFNSILSQVPLNNDDCQNETVDNVIQRPDKHGDMTYQQSFTKIPSCVFGEPQNPLDSSRGKVPCDVQLYVRKWGLFPETWLRACSECHYTPIQRKKLQSLDKQTGILTNNTLFVCDFTSLKEGMLAFSDICRNRSFWMSFENATMPTLEHYEPSIANYLVHKSVRICFATFIFSEQHNRLPKSQFPSRL